MVRVLVVDDDQLIPEMVCRALRRRGHEAIAVSTYDEAVAHLSAGPWTHLLTDIRMPGGGGLALAAQARARHPDLRVVFMSGASRAEVGLPPEVELLLKPFEIADVLIRLGLPSPARP
jgi:two-component system, cell cycle sensor histidine kinase and response regulator CckA